MSTDVAVIIPLFNGSRWIEGTLKSVFAQSLPPAEVIVVDDGSTDDGKEIARSFARVTVVENPRKGANPARRFGFERTSAPFVAFLDQDDFWHPAHLENQVPWLLAHPDVRAGHAKEFDVTGQHPEPEWEPTDNRRRRVNAWDAFPLAPVIGTPSATVLRRTALEAIGGWPVAYIGVADYFTWLGLSANGTQVGGIVGTMAVTVARRRHNTSYSAALRKPGTLEKYSSNLLAASLDAAARFGRFSTLAEHVRRRRTDLARHFHAACLAAAVGNWGNFSAAGHSIAALTSEEPEAFRSKLGGMLVWMLDGPRRLSEALVVFQSAHDAWPESDTPVRNALATKHRVYIAMRRARPPAPSSP